MIDGMGMWVILGLLVVVMGVAAVRSVGQPNEEEQDLEHLDHQLRGDDINH